MCNITDNEEYTQRWDDYFEHVNTDIRTELSFEDELYQAYGAFNGLPVETLREWHEDAARYLVSTSDGFAYIHNKYADFPGLSDDDVYYFLDKEIGDGMLYENRGYWFRA